MQYRNIALGVIFMNSRLHYADLLRISAAFMVVLLHVAAQYWKVLPVTSAEWFIMHCYDSIARPAVAIFVMISGMFLLHPAKEISISQIFSRYCKKIIIVLLFWTFFYATWHDVFWTAYRGRIIDWPTVTRSLQTGHYHLWYCYMLLGLYLLLPLLRNIAANRTLLQYFLALAFVFTAIMPVLPYPWAKTIRVNMYFGFTSGFTGYFLLGYYLRTTTLTKKQRLLCYLAGIGGLLFTIIASYHQALLRDTAFGYYNPFTLNTLCLTMAVFVFYQYEIPQLFRRCQSSIAVLVENSLGIYLIHPFVLAVLQYCNVDALFFSPTVLSIPLLALIVFLISCLLTLVVRSFPLLEKYLC